MNYEKKKRFNETKDDKTKVTFITTTTATRNNWRFCDWFDEKLEITNKLIRKKLKKTLKNKKKSFVFWQVGKQKEGRKISTKPWKKKKLTY